MADRYPHQPAASGLSAMTFATSEEAANAIASTVTCLRLLALRTVDRLGTATSHEGCEAANLPRDSLRPRFSELLKMGLLEPTGERRRNRETGKSAAVLRVTDKGRAVLVGDQP